MKVSPIAPRDQTCGRAFDGIVPLIKSLRTRHFGDALFATARGVFRCEQLSAFALLDDSSPRLLFSVDSERSVIAKRIGTRSLSFWDREPANTYVAKLRSSDEGDFCIRLSADEMLRSPYRRQCYDATSWTDVGSKLVDRVTLARHRHGRLLKINFYRHGDEGRFDDSDIDRFIEWSDLLISLVEKHGSVDESRPHPSSELYEAVLNRHARFLSAREIEVCADIALGMTSEAIALKLNISSNTVLTYRKRAYGRLGISSQNELTHLLYKFMDRDGDAPAIDRMPLVGAETH